jgi:DNA repair protein RecO (recombination protein O)
MMSVNQARRYRTNALVIRHFDFGEADRILTLFTPHLGKISVIAKGVRRLRSRSAGHVELFTHCNLLLARGRNLDVVTQAEGIEHFTGLRADLMLSSYAHYVSELLDAFAPDRMPNVALFNLHLLTLRRLNEGAGTFTLRTFEMDLMDLSGYRPELHSCVGCGAEICPQTNRLSVSLGGILCPECFHADPRAPEVSITALKLLRNLQTDSRRVLALQSVDDRVAREIELRMRDYIMYRMERRPRSVAVLDTLEKEYSIAGSS